MGSTQSLYISMASHCLVAISWLYPFAVTADEVPQTEFAAAIALEKALVATIEKAEGAVVAIARGRRGVERELTDPQFVPHEFSAGVVVDEGGLILTNYHTLGSVKENAYVVWSQKKSFVAKVKAADPWTDLAVLEIKAKNLQPIKFGDGSQLRKGRIVIALGNPHAIARDGNVSATWGIVSNVHRKIDGPLQGVEGPDIARRRDTLYHFGGLIQTDAKLAKSTSGGPLLDLNGNMVGLSTSLAMLAGFEKGTGYAIPVTERFQQVVEKLKRGEEIESGFLGVAPRNPDPGTREVGVILERVELGTPAALGGLKDLDEVVRIDGHPVQSSDDLFYLIGSQRAGHVARIGVREADFPIFRGANVNFLDVRLAKKPNSTFRSKIATQVKPAWRGIKVDYATALSLRRIENLDPEGCVIVTEVEQDSVGWDAGLRLGTVVSRVNGAKVTTPKEFRAAVEGLQGVVRFMLFDPFQGRSTVMVAPN